MRFPQSPRWIPPECSQANLLSSRSTEHSMGGALPPARITFGTDGWRGRIADDYTFAAVRRCAQGFAAYLAETEGTGKPVVVGFDKRFLSEHFAASASEVLAGNGFHVLLTEGPTPTPAIAYAVVQQGAAGAVNITAS